jgi:hypothetical protein
MTPTLKIVPRIGDEEGVSLIKDRVAVIVFNNKEVEKLAADIKEKIACVESSGMVCMVSPATRAGSMHVLSMSRCTGRGRG